MPAFLAVSVYVLALALPMFLLYWFHSQHWIWHTISVIAAIGLGFVPIPPALQRPGFDLVIGFAFIALLVWGAGGLILYNTRGHREKHA